MSLESALVHGWVDGNGVDDNLLSCEALVAGLRLLLTADLCAVDTAEDAWFFAVEIDQLRDAGVLEPWLRWLVVKSLVIHRAETTLFGQEDRTFRDIGRLRFCPESCFVLTPEGRRFARELCANGAADTPAQSSRMPRPLVDNGRLTDTPHWDCVRKELLLDGTLVKRFRVQSPNQETVLMAFQEEGWPVRIDDPLPPTMNQCSKRRLHDTIKNLNRHQSRRVIRFQGDGTGEGVRWARVSCAAEFRESAATLDASP
jgi:hypothetical protein